MRVDNRHMMRTKPFAVPTALLLLLVPAAVARAEGVKIIIDLATYRYTSDGKPLTDLPEKKTLLTSATIPAQVDAPFDFAQQLPDVTIIANGKVSSDNRNPHRLNLRLEYHANARTFDFSLTSTIVVTLNRPRILSATQPPKAGDDGLVTVATVRSAKP